MAILLMTFHWSLSDNKSPQVHGTLLSILVYLNNGLANFPSLLGPFTVHQLEFVSLSPSCSIAFLVLWQDLSISLYFRFL